MMDNEQAVLSFARDELKQCLAYMTCGKYVDGIEIGIMPDSASDHPFDDEIAVEVTAGQGTLLGSNARSALYAVYAFLEHAGCRFIRPGADGEYLPRTKVSALNGSFRKRAQSRHRCVCIEGANSLEQILELIDFLPKIGMNGYFMQFDNGYVFFERWYNRYGDTAFNEELAEQMTSRVEAAVAKRGLIYHKVGHGWTAKALGGQSHGWQSTARSMDSAHQPLAAEIGGARDWFRGVPDNTNLCYSNPDAREAYVRSVVDYAAAHPNIDVLHVWMVDECNNHCECDECKKALPSDYYVMMLNEIDRRLTARGSAMKIAFVVYLESMYASLHERFGHDDRFLLLFCPITRDYRHAFIQPAKDPGAVFQRNRLRFPEDVGENLYYLKQWQRITNCDSADYDYHLLWAYYTDPGHITLSKVLHEDLSHFNSIGLNGYISCQAQRVFLPTGWPMRVMGETLYNGKMDYGKRRSEYFFDVFGIEGDGILRALDALNQRLDLSWLEDITLLADDPPGDPEGARAIMKSLIDTAERVLAEETDSCRRKSFDHLRLYALLLDRLLSLRANARDGRLNPDELSDFLQWLREMEPEWMSAFDDMLLKNLVRDGNPFIGDKRS